MPNKRCLLVVCAGWTMTLLPSTLAQDEPQSPPVIALARDTEGAWRFFVDDTPFPLRGAGGAEAPGLLEALVAAGGNVVRTWGTETLAHTYENGERYIDRAHRLGLMVIPGLWVQHERHGFDYGDPEVIREQRERILAEVRAYKDHPAVLAWGLGNEMEGPSDPSGSAVVFREVEELAKLIKAEDPTRPVMTVIAFHPGKIRPVMELCPSIDILGLNSYGGAAGAGPALKAAGWTKPFAVTEFGVLGFWEVPATPWGAPLEPTSQAKARTYYATHKLVFEENDGHELCLGTFAFLWGWKQERTATWFGMFLPTGEKLPSVDAMTRAWTGSWPTNRCPKLTVIHSEAAGATVLPGRTLGARIDVTDSDDDPLSAHWALFRESSAHSEGGDAEYIPDEIPGRIVYADAMNCTLLAPEEPGPYRLFVTVRDGRGNAATANFPFLVEPAL
jgi:hypothetical protein